MTCAITPLAADRISTPLTRRLLVCLAAAKYPRVKRAEARAFIDFLVSAPIQRAIAAFKRDEYGESLFFPDAIPQQRNSNSQLPRVSWKLEIGSWELQGAAVNELFGAITQRTMVVSGVTTALSVLVGVPIRYAVARRSFRGRTVPLGRTLIHTDRYCDLA